jgi:hypothetical protein
MCIPNGSKRDQMAVKYTNLFHSKPLKITQNGIFGLKIYHLATLCTSGLPDGIFSNQKSQFG